MSDRDIRGREAELAAVGDFLAGLVRGPATLILDGEAGIGKTTVWHAAADTARAQRIRVLATRPAPAEARLTHVGLADLLDGVEESVLAALPGPQRRALEVGLLRADPVTGAGTGQRVVSTALLTVLRTLAAATPVLVAIDDMQWLDTASRHVLEFALRRLTAEPVGVLATARTGEAGPVREFVHAMPPGRSRTVEIGRLDAVTLQHIVDARFGRRLGRRALVRIVAAAAGNPLYALEIGRAMVEHPADATGSLPPPIPDDLRTLLVRRVRRLPAACQYVLLVAAAQSDPRMPAADIVALAPAERAGVVTLDRGRVRFAHPLLASAIYGSAPTEARRRVHRVLAERAEGPEERARHLALGADGPHEEIAAALVAAAAQIRSRGAPDAAADLLELAVSATPEGQDAARRERSMAAAENHFHAGDRARAHALAAEVAADAPPGGLLGRALRLLGMISYHEDSYVDAARLLESAVDHVLDDPLVVDLRVNLAHVRVSLGDLPGSATEAARALTQARRFGDKAAEAAATAVSAMADLFVGQPPDWEAVDRALVGEDPDRQGAIQVRPGWIAGAMRLYCDQLAPARVHLTALRQRMIERGEESDLPFLSFHLTMLERLDGNIPLALGYAGEGYRLARQLGSRNLELLNLGERCLARALAGDVPGARADATAARALAEQTGYPAGMGLALAATGHLDLMLGDVDAAASAMAPIAELVAGTGFCHPVLAFYLQDAIEAFVATGRVEEADALVGPLRRAGVVAGRPNVVAVAGRCRALVLAARGDVGGAAAAVDEALSIGGGAHLPLDLARTLLLRGQLHRRARQKLQAREAVQDSLAIFERVGAVLWVRRAAAELARVGRPAAASDQLSVTEERVASLAAAGLTNREIADRSFLSPKTVEANLARVYRKFAIHSRAELGARMRDRGVTS